MKKSIKKLTLSKSTISNMTAEKQQQVKGGAVTTTDLSFYPCPSVYICASADGNCYTFRLSCVYECSGNGCASYNALCEQ